MIKPLIKGLGITLKHFLNPLKIVTVQYPDEKLEISPRYRGLHEQLRDKNGVEKCVACGLCAKACPSDCIKINGTEDKNGQRKADVYEIDMLRCIFCGYCEEACPVNAIRLTQGYEFAMTDEMEKNYTKERLLTPIKK